MQGRQLVQRVDGLVASNPGRPRQRADARGVPPDAEAGRHLQRRLHLQTLGLPRDHSLGVSLPGLSETLVEIFGTNDQKLFFLKKMFFFR